MDYAIGTTFKNIFSKRKDTETVIDIYKTYNSNGELINTEYLVEHDFCGQKVKHTVCKAHITRCLL